MISFRTELPIKDSLYRLSHKNNILNIGSCFSENIGERLKERKFPIHINPFGILFNPISIANSLSKVIDNQLFTENNIFEHNTLWHSFQHHGKFSNIDKLTCLNGINTSIKTANNHIQDLQYLILTFGTANVFVHKSTNEIVANCHKIPNNQFERRRLSVQEIVTSLSPQIQRLKIINPQLKVILTVSPVRHIRDGLVENQRSKAVLLLAIDNLIKSFDFVEYFPAYELLMDDLRDYRFYEKDMIHPSKIAIDYIWEAFANTYFEEKTKQINLQIKKVNQAKNHRPLNPNSLDYQKFIHSQIGKIKKLQKQFSYINFQEDLAHFEAQL